MPYRLAIDTCGARCAVSLFVCDPVPAPLVEYEEPMAKGHAERLVPMISEVLADGGLDVKDLSLIIVNRGPGSFTNVRIGVAVARGLAIADSTPVAGVSSLEARAKLVSENTDSDFLIAEDARRDQVYAQRFGAAGVPKEGPDLIMIEDLKNGGPFADLPVFGSAAVHLGRAPSFLDGPIPLQIMVEMVEDEGSFPPITPLYVRPPDAKPQSGKVIRRAP